MNPLTDDLLHISRHLAPLFKDLAGKRMLITGGTGFFGKWLLSALIWLNEHEKVGTQIIVLTRDSGKFLASNPEYRTSCIRFMNGDIRNFDFPAEPIEYVIHAATDVSTARTDPMKAFDVCVSGTNHVLSFAKKCGVRRFLLTSSGAVYGDQPQSVQKIEERYKGAPNTLSIEAGYAEGKRAAEWLCCYYDSTFGMQCEIARCFAFAGPFLDLHAGYAFGSFIANALRGEKILVEGDGTPLRSYLYGADLVIWLMTILLRGKRGKAYNVGSDQRISIEALARKIDIIGGSPQGICVQRPHEPGTSVQQYIPSIQEARKDLGLVPFIGLDEAISRTLLWHRRRGNDR